MKIILVIASLASSLPPWAAMADVECLGPPAPRFRLVAALEASYGESQRDWMVEGSEILYELFVNPKTGTWTLLRSWPTGLSCVGAEGEGWTPPPGKQI